MQARQPESDASLIEQRIQQDADLAIAVEEADGALRLVGLADSEEARQAADDIARAAVPDRRIINDIEIEESAPVELDDLGAGELDSEPRTADGILTEEIEPSFEEQELLTDPFAASGPSSSSDDLVGDGDATYFPPTDPVFRVAPNGDAEIVGGFSSTSDASIEVDRSSDGMIGDEALADAIRRELREDASTADLDIDVVVTNGIARLRGQVSDLDDAENAEAVARTVPGLADVIEELEVTEL
jgi:osmotically-inducible protein OsmY